MTVGSSDYLGDKDPARPRLTILLWHETGARVILANISPARRRRKGR